MAAMSHSWQSESLQTLVNRIPSLDNDASLRVLSNVGNQFSKTDICRMLMIIFKHNPPERWFLQTADDETAQKRYSKILQNLVEHFCHDTEFQHWSCFIQHALTSKTTKTKWWSIRFVQMLIGIPERRVITILSDNLDFQKQLQLRLDLLKPDKKCAKSLTKMTKNIECSDPPVAVTVSGSTFVLPNITQVVSGPVHAPCPSAEISFDTLCSAASCGLPVLVQGPVGCGKSTLLRYLGQQVQRCSPPCLVTIQLGEQMDSKALFGSYCCTEVPGEFLWKPGPITLAAQHGNWIILEDIESATEDIVSTLLLLIENKRIQLPGLTTFTVHSQFRLFATSRCDNKFRTDANCSYILDRFPVKILLEPFSKQELIRMISTDSRLSGISRPLVDAFMVANQCLQQANVKRKIGPRDLLKWHKRLAACAIDDHVSIYRAAVDCLLRHVGKTKDRIQAIATLANKLNVTQAQVDYYENVHRPAVKVNSDEIEIGRVKISRLEGTKIARRSESYALTLNACQLLERISLCVSYNEPVLLVGETGCGKTATVQFLADYTGHKLNVVNLSPQSESTDLLGGYKPVTLKTIISPLKERYLELFEKCFDMNKNKKFLKHIQVCYTQQKWNELVEIMTHTAKKAIAKTKMIPDWNEILSELEKFRRVVNSDIQSLPFGLIEGVLVNAIRRGEWVLLDEINLAPSETLDCLYSFLDAMERRDPVLLPFSLTPIQIHPEFRILACMNPATDVGKKDLGAGIRNRLTEFFTEEVSSVQDLKLLTETYLRGLSVPATTLNAVVHLYVDLKAKALSLAADSWGHHPQYSLRTFCRALAYASTNPFGNVKRSLYEAFCVSFMTELDLVSQYSVRLMIQKSLLSVNAETCAAIISTTPLQANPKSMLVQGYWIETGTEPHAEIPFYIITPSVKTNLHNLARAISAKRFPILLQGETCVGKTSLIKYVACLTGNKVIRINNHEHTDLQEYLGSYSSDADGKLKFVEGPLVEAIREGYWVILDELNLAPIDVLEALNRVLDDNREIFIPETQTVVKAHPSFQLLATQNPPGLYGGRKQLSRAFRNRFIQLNFSEFPENELGHILEHRCGLPASYAAKMVATMHELQVFRNSCGVFAGKESYMTLRDLFRWGESLGFLLLGGRCRRVDDAKIVIDVLQKLFKRQIDPERIYSINSPYLTFNTQSLPKGLQHIVWTRNTLRVAVLLGQAITFDEPCLLIGDTGCGKTSLCQLLSNQLGCADLLCISCHLMSEAGDFLGRLRPAPIQDAEAGILFKWCDGPLVKAMKEGRPILVDEISLADDSVLERLNSVLESERTLLLPELPESSNDNSRYVVASAGFKLMATMNPAGDFGKKELSRALRNRLTEVWCDSDFERDDLFAIAQHNLHANIKHMLIPSAMLDFVSWFMLKTDGSVKLTFTVRNLLAWVEFINHCVAFLDPAAAYIHGAFLVLLDSLGCSSNLNPEMLRQLVQDSLVWLCEYCRVHMHRDITPAVIVQTADNEVIVGEKFGLHPFFIDSGDLTPVIPKGYSFDAPTCGQNVLAILRALSIGKALLLEGPPGVGKSSLIVAIASSAGHKLTRLNLSEQTELSDLLGTDVPVTLANGQQAFAWCDGPLLTAMKEGHWVLLDEMNLASQAVLEGLNACLDHRGEVFIPELARSFKVSPHGTRFFACQNPYSQGGDRRGLPKSFINRFCPVYVQELTAQDELIILKKLPHNLEECTLQMMIDFNTKIREELCVKRSFGGNGGPWEFNLRDLMRWTEIMHKLKCSDPSSCLDLIYLNRLRTLEDRKAAAELWGCSLRTPELTVSVTPEVVHVGRAVLKRFDQSPSVDSVQNGLLLKSQMKPLEQLLFSLSMGWVILLVGASGVGKTEVVKTAAGLCGRLLHVIYLSAETDAGELLGCFEQVSLEHRIGMLKQCLNDFCNQKCKQLFDLRPNSKFTKYLEWKDKCSAAVTAQPLLHICEMIQKTEPLSEILQSNIQNLKRNMQKASATFEWTESPIVQAYKNGDWLLVENVNMCSASVLDRLNSALEVGGQMTLPECGADTNGNIPVYNAHPQFRIIFTMDPKLGPISRAMRNRSCEVCMIEEEAWFLDEEDSVNVVKHTAELNWKDSHQVYQQFRCAKNNDDTIVGKLNGHDLISTALQVGWAVRKRGDNYSVDQLAATAMNMPMQADDGMHDHDQLQPGELRCSVRDMCYDSVSTMNVMQSQSWAKVARNNQLQSSCLIWNILTSPKAMMPFRMNLINQTLQDAFFYQTFSQWNENVHSFGASDYEAWDPRFYPMMCIDAMLDEKDKGILNGKLCSLIYSVKLKEAQITIQRDSALDLTRKVNNNELNLSELPSPALALMIKINNRIKKILVRIEEQRIYDDHQANILLSELWCCMQFVKACRERLSGLQGQIVTLRILWKWMTELFIPLLMQFDDKRLQVLCSQIDEEWSVEQEGELAYLRSLQTSAICDPFPSKAKVKDYKEVLDCLHRITIAVNQNADACDVKNEMIRLLLSDQQDPKLQEISRNDCSTQWLLDCTGTLAMVVSHQLTDQETMDILQYCNHIPQFIAFDRCMAANSAMRKLFDTLHWLNSQDLNTNLPKISFMNVRNVHTVLMPSVTLNLCDLLEKCSFGDIENISMKDIGEIKRSVQDASVMLWKFAPSLVYLKEITGGQIHECGLLRLVSTVLGSDFSSERDLFSDLASRQWLTMGIEFMKALTPPVKMMDPVLKAQVQLALLKQQLEMVTTELWALNEYNRNVTGSKMVADWRRQHTHPFVHALISKKRHLETEIDSVQKLGHTGYRPKNSQHEQLCVDMLSFVTLTESTFKETAQLNDQLRLARLIGWLQSAEHVSKRLISSYPAYVDVTFPFCLGLNMAMLGANLAVFHAVNKGVDEGEVVDLIKMKWLHGKCSFGTNNWTLQDNDLVSRKSQVHLIKSALGRTLDSANAYACLQFVLQNCQEIEEMKEKEQPLSYKYHKKQAEREGEEEDTIDTDRLARKLMFPDTEFDDETDDAEGEELKKLVKKRTDVERETVQLLRRLIDNVKGNDKEQLKGGDDAYACAMQVVSAHKDVFMMMNERNILHRHILQFKNIENKLSCFDVPVTLDVYHDTCSSVALPLVQKIHNLKKAAGQLHQEWPEISALPQICESADRVLSYPVGTPVVQLALAVEDLLREADEWEKVASRAVTLEACLAPLRATLLQWRKQQVRSWEQLLHRTRMELQDKLIIDAARLIQATLTDDILDPLKVDAICDTAMQWMQEATLIEFSTRLEIFEFIENWLRKWRTEDEVAVVLMQKLGSMRLYWTQYESMIQKKLTDAKSGVEKELKDVVQVIKFQDLSLWSVKLMSQKAHSQLFRIVKKYKEAVIQPITPLLSLLFDADAEPTSVMIAFEPPKCSDLEISLKIEKLWLISKRHCSSIVSRLDSGTCMEMLCDLTDSVKETSDAVNETVNYDPESEKAVKEKLYRRNMAKRQKLVSNLFKILKESGFMYRKGTMITEEVLGSELVVDMPNLVGQTELNQKLEQHIRKCAANRCIVIAASSKPNKQVTPQAAKSIYGLTQLIPSLIHNWLKLLTKSVQETSAMNSECKILNKMMVEIKEYGSVISNQKDASTYLTEMLNLDGQRLQSVLDSANCVECAPKDETCALNFHAFQQINPQIAFLNKSMQELIKMKSDIDTFAVKWVTDQRNDSRHVSRNELKNCLTVQNLPLETIVRDCSTILEPVIEKCKPKLESPQDDVLFPTFSDAHSYAKSLEVYARKMRDLLDTKQMACGHADIESLAEKTVNEILLVIQRIVHKLDTVVIGNDSVPAAFDALASLLQVGDVQRVVSMLSEVMSSVVENCAADSAALESLAAIVCLCSLLHKLFTHLQSLFTAYLLEMCSLYLHLTHAFHKLLMDGFMPLIPDLEEGEGKGGHGQLQDVQGGGIGEGHGDKDVSDQIDETGQVEGTKDEEKCDEAPPPNKDEDKPLEMEDDIDAALEDVKLDEGEESSEEDGQDEPAEPDVQMGENENPQEEQLDPKLWDQPEINELGEDDRGAQEESEQLVAKDDNQQTNDKQTGENFDANEEEEKDEDKPEDGQENDDIDMENIDMQDVESVDDSDNEQEKEKGQDENLEEDEDTNINAEQVNDDSPVDEQEETELNIDDTSAAQMTSASNTGKGQNEQDELDIMQNEEKVEEKDEGQKEENENDQENADQTPQEKGMKRSMDGEVGEIEPKEMIKPPVNKRKKLSQDEKTLGDSNQSFQNDVEIDKGQSKDEEKGRNDSNVWSHDANMQNEMGEQVLDAATLEQAQTQVKNDADEGTDDENMDTEQIKPDIDEKTKEKSGNIDENKIESDSKLEQIDGDYEMDKMDEDFLPHSSETTIHTVPDFYQHALQLHAHDLECKIEPPVSLNSSDGQSVWTYYRNRTDQLAAELSENLRLILEPSKASKLQGDYRTGKRLNIRRLIPYIASHFRKDKIWLRRTKKSKRDYRIMVAVDDSASMADNKTKEMALESVALLCNALKYMDAGQVGVCKFGTDAQLLHAFGHTFSDQAGANIVSNLTFQQKATDIIKLMELSSSYMSAWPSSETGSTPSNLLLIVSDGRGLFSHGIDRARRAVQSTMHNNIFIVFIVLDNPEHKDSIVDIQVPVFKGPHSIPDIKTYLDFFPFPFYVILRKMEALPATAGDALRQWFELVATEK